jgi:hypothetical protein
MKQIALALHSFHDSMRSLPVNMGPWPTPSSPAPITLTGKGWIVSILPQLEQAPLFDKFSSSVSGSFLDSAGIKRIECRQWIAHQLEVLQCPSDPSVCELSTVQFQLEGIPVALTSYKGVIGDTQLGGYLSRFPGSTDCHYVGRCNGLFFRTTYCEPQRFSAVTDGLSSTFMVGEDCPEFNDHSAAYYSNTDYASCNIPINFFPSPPTPRDWPNVMSFRSRHVRGAQFAKVDGSVIFVGQEISRVTYRALSTKNGGEGIDVIP